MPQMWLTELNLYLTQNIPLIQYYYRVNHLCLELDSSEIPQQTGVCHMTVLTLPLMYCMTQNMHWYITVPAPTNTAISWSKGYMLWGSCRMEHDHDIRTFIQLRVEATGYIQVRASLMYLCYRGIWLQQVHMLYRSTDVSQPKCSVGNS